MSALERSLGLGAVLLLIIGLAGYIIDQRLRVNEAPVVGGTYSEGILNDSPTKVERLITRLTNTGLTYTESDGTIKPSLAERWETSPDGKIYTFHLKSQVSAPALLSIIQNSKTSWNGIEITAPAEQELKFSLAEAQSLFLTTTVQPIFPFGPYEVAKREKNEVVLRSNDKFSLQAAYIPKVSLKSYETQDQLVKAAKDGEIDGSADFADTPPRGFVEKNFELPRFEILFFNMTKPAFKKPEDRQRLITESDGPPVTYTLLTADNGELSEAADSLARRLAEKHITLNVIKKNGMTLQKEEIGKREFDLLLYGISYGVSRDYYPFWHSSQATQTGLNVSGLKDKELDALLEQAHKESDGAKREILNKQIEDMLNQKSLQKIINQEKFKFWVNKSIKGVNYATIATEGTDRFSLLWQWYRKTKAVR